jgi:hypothetical protein
LQQLYITKNNKHSKKLQYIWKHWLLNRQIRKKFTLSTKVHQVSN